ncbi:MAG: carboxypeptidase regulatory-like domain-containing protein, partial [Kribbellaceae bacterium]|nr:carboxypeptidase regulatory-like domain-containing protein [Kribbellaceae bacterium]
MRRLAGIVVLLLTASLLGAPAPAQALTPSSTPNSLTTSPDVETKIVGTVRDIAGQPIAGACVDAHPSQWVYVAHACTDTAGRYEIHDVVPDYSYRLEVTAVGFASRWWPQGLDYLDGTGVFPAAGTTAVADIVLPATADATGTMTGTILRQDGVPASSALVRVNTGGTWTASTYTGPDGRYQLDRLSAGAYIVQVSGAGYAAQFVPGQTAQSSAQPQIVTAGATTVVDETFRARTPAPNVLAGKVSGTVHDPAGNPVAGATIVAYSGSAVFMSDSVYGQTVTDQDGHYVLTGPIQGLPLVYMRTTAPGYATTWSNGGVRPVASSIGTNTVKDVVLRPGVGAITGTLRDFDGGVPPRTGLSFTTLDQTLTFGTVSWFDGHFEIPNVPAGQYRLTLQPSSRPVQYWPGATDQTQGAVVTVTDGTTTDLQETLIRPA